MRVLRSPMVIILQHESPLLVPHHTHLLRVRNSMADDSWEILHCHPLTGLLSWTCQMSHSNFGSPISWNDHCLMPFHSVFSWSTPLLDFAASVSEIALMWSTAWSPWSCRSPHSFTCLRYLDLWPSFSGSFYLASSCVAYSASSTGDHQALKLAPRIERIEELGVDFVV